MRGLDLFYVFSNRKTAAQMTQASEFIANQASLLSFAVADGLPLGGMGRTAPTGARVGREL